jgi:hypothetical protein
VVPVRSALAMAVPDRGIEGPQPVIRSNSFTRLGASAILAYAIELWNSKRSSAVRGNYSAEGGISDLLCSLFHGDRRLSPFS